MSHARRLKSLERTQIRELPDESLLTANEVSKLVRVSPDEVRRWLNTGDLRSIRIGTGRELRVPRFEVRAFLARRLGAMSALANEILPPGD